MQPREKENGSITSYCFKRINGGTDNTILKIFCDMPQQSVEMIQAVMV
jgi:hypothetical protein